MSESEDAIARQREQILARPPEQFHDLSLEHRWEASRRHPHYLLFWSSALTYFRGESNCDEARRFDDFLSHLILGLIGVTGQPVDPRTSFRDLGAIDPSFLSGAIQPVQFRGFVTMMISALPKAERIRLGEVLLASADDSCRIEGDDVNLALQRQHAMAMLSMTPSAALDSYPQIPLVYIHLGASQRTIASEVSDLVRRMKSAQRIPERRVPTKKLASYLKVWDLREGWTGTGYDRRQENPLAEIARRVKRPITTVFERYKSAFKMITGYDYTPERWQELFLCYKLREWRPNTAAEIAASIRRRLFHLERRPVPDSVVTPPEFGGGRGNDRRRGGFVANNAIAADDRESTELLLDCHSLIEQGRSNEEIAQALECSIEMVDYIRTQHNDRVNE